MFLHKMELLYSDKVAKFSACLNQAKSSVPLDVHEVQKRCVPCKLSVPRIISQWLAYHFQTVIKI